MGGYSEVHRCDSSKILESAEIWSVENETKVASGVGSLGCSERAVLYFRELLFKSNKQKFHQL